MFLKRPCMFLFLLAFIIGISTHALAAASGVIRVELPDAAAVGKGSAFVGEANRASAVYYNPAGIVQTAVQLSIGMAVLQPSIEAKPVAGGKVQMRRNNIAFPHVFFTTPVIADKFYVGVGEASNFGSGNDWAGDSPASFTRYSMTHDEFENKDIMLVGAYKFNDQLSLAVGATNDDSKIEKSKKLYQGAGADGNSQLKAKDNDWGYQLAALYKVNQQHQFGLTYRSAIHHKYEGKLYFDGLNNTTPIFGGAGGYSDVFGGSAFETKATQKITLPQSIALGYSFKPTNQWTFNFDIEWLDWSSTKNSTIDFPDVNATQASILATNNPQSRDWKSVFSESIGLEYAATDRLRLRGGYAYHATPIGKTTWDTAFPDANSHSFTTGLGYDLTSKLTLDLAYVADFYETRKINNTVDSGFQANLSGKYKQFINIGLATLTYKY